MDHKIVGLFYIKKKRSNINFKLELSSWIRLHSVFYVKKLKSANSKILVRIKESLKFSRYNKYKVEKIEDYNLKTRQYIVKWKRYPKEENTWELVEYLGNCKEIIKKSEYPLERDNVIIKNFDFRQPPVWKQRQLYY